MPVTDGNGFKSHKSDWPTPRKIGDFFLFPSSSSWKKKTTRRPKEGGGWPTIGKGCCSALFVPLHLSFRPRKNTRGGGGNALTMRNGRCCVSARAMGQARCKCVACTFYSPFFPLFPSLSLSLSLSFFNAATSAVKTELVGWTGSPKLKGVAKSLAMNGLGKLVDDIANFRIINLDCGNWSICLFHKPFSLELYMKNHRRRIFPVEIFSPGKKYKCIAICNTRIKIIWYMHKSKYHARRVYQF